MKLTKAWVLDTGERVAATFAMTFLSALTLTSLAGVKVAAVAGAAAALSVLKGLAAGVLSNPNSASLAGKKLATPPADVPYTPPPAP